MSVRQRLDERLTRRELKPQEDGAHKLDHQHRGYNPHDKRPEASHAGDAVCVHQRELARKRDAPPHHDKEKSGACHDARAAELHETQKD